ncbi:hypothetical protein [Maritalea porphyrae]|uniref:hypothetical protein n=1 Tax=Maritalea porphyrae TaxID=880732 RepID=UPI0022B015AE|nr:hypothetical protein [Maritalea porphyrae]MCZ4272474.1 hypothetical protein [Maritalea porphyrae]
MSGAVTWEIVSLIAGIGAMLVTIVSWSFRVISLLRKEIAEHKLYAANHYATKDGVNQELEKFRQSIDRLIDRIDRALEK